MKSVKRSVLATALLVGSMSIACGEDEGGGKEPATDGGTGGAGTGGAATGGAGTGGAATGGAGTGGAASGGAAAGGTDGGTSVPAGIDVAPTQGLQTTEGGTNAVFAVVLERAPTADVTIPISSSDATEGTVSPTSLTFTTFNWDQRQNVTVTGEDDGAVDGSQTFSVRLGAASSTDTDYDGLDPTDVQVTNIDDDAAGIVVAPTAGLMTSETGGTARFTVILQSQPSADVIVGVSSSNAAEIGVGPTSLTFTNVNWNRAQTVTVTGQDDSLADGNQPATVITAAATSTDTAYNGIDAADVTVINQDNDRPGITVNPQLNLATIEDGSSATFTVVLNTEPTASVTLGVSSSDTTEGTVSPVGLTFTAANWNVPQTVTVTGEDDVIIDGSVAYQVVTAAASSADVAYSGLNPPDVSVVNLDNEASITVTPTTSLQTSEDGATARFTVVLGTPPTANVVISLRSTDTSEGRTSTGTLTFTSADWSTPQTVTVTGQNDANIDGNISYGVVLDPAVSSDSRYSGFNPADVALVNLDDDSAGVTVQPLNLAIQEAGDSKAFTVVLNTQPTSNVTIDLTSSDGSEAMVTPAALTFTSGNWSVPQSATVTGQSDNVADGNQTVTIATSNTSSGDANYDSLVVPNVEVTVIDIDQPGITVTPTNLLVGESKIPSQRFSVFLSTEPSAPVTIPVASTDTSEGTIDASFLMFTAANWSNPQYVTVSGANDGVADGDQSFLVTVGPASSPDAQYDRMDPADVQVRNVDDETPGIAIIPQSLVVTESGTQATFLLVMQTSPDTDVDISIQSSDTGEVTVNPSDAHFAGGTTNLVRTITVTGVDDSTDDGDQRVNIVIGAAISTDPDYSGVNAPDVEVTNVDDDQASLVVQLVGPTTCPGCNELRVDEDGTPNRARFTVALSSAPTANVTLAVASNDGTEGTASPAQLVFNADNWSTPQTVTVDAEDDDRDDGDQTFQVDLGPATSTDTSYVGVAGAVSALNKDDDQAAILVGGFSPGLVGTPARMRLREGSTGSFTVRLETRPVADVVISLVSSDTNEVTANPPSLTFTTANYDVPRTVNVMAVDDSALNAILFEEIGFAPATSDDPIYDGARPDVAGQGPALLVRITDDDEAGVTVTAPLEANAESVLVVRESGTSSSFTVVLNAQPTGLVQVNVLNNLSSVTLGGDLVAGSLTFTTANWNTPQTVTVTGGSRSGANEINAVELTISTAATVDARYDAVNPDDVTVINLHEDSPQVTVYPSDVGAQPEVARNWGENFSFLMVLNTQPVADVVMPVRVRTQDEAFSGCYEGQYGQCGPPWDALDRLGGSMDQYIDLSPLDVTFTAGNYATPQSVTVSCLTPASGPIASSDWYWSEISVLEVVSNDAGYDQLDLSAPDVQCFNPSP